VLGSIGQMDCYCQLRYYSQSLEFYYRYLTYTYVYYISQILGVRTICCVFQSFAKLPHISLTKPKFQTGEQFHRLCQFFPCWNFRLVRTLHMGPQCILRKAQCGFIFYTKHVLVILINFIFKITITIHITNSFQYLQGVEFMTRPNQKE